MLCDITQTVCIFNQKSLFTSPFLGGAIKKIKIQNCFDITLSTTFNMLTSDNPENNPAVNSDHSSQCALLDFCHLINECFLNSITKNKKYSFFNGSEQD